jgi:assimilatory nitrate reductase catalytic subunit
VDILAGLAAAVGSAGAFSYGGPSEVFDELARATAGGPADYAGMSYERLDREDGLYWPCPSPDHPGTPRLFEDGFPTVSGRARFHPTPHGDPAETCDDTFPLHLTTGRVLAHYQSGNQTRRVESLRKAAEEPTAEMHPVMAARMGVGDGDRVRLSSRRGSAEFAIRITRSIREDTVFLPFHWGGEQAANRLTHAALDPVSRMPEFKICAVRAEATPAETDPSKDEPR